MKDGAIVERGQHRDLVKLGGVYTELYNTQFKKVDEEGRVKETVDRELKELATES